MDSYKKMDGVLEYIDRGLCFWRRPADNTMFVTNILLEPLIDAADLDGEVKFISSIGGGFFLMTGDDGKFLLSREISPFEFSEGEDDFKFDIVHALCSDDDVVYFRTPGAVFTVEENKIIKVYGVGSPTAFLSYFYGGLVSASFGGVIERYTWKDKTVWKKNLTDCFIEVGLDIDLKGVEVERCSGIIGEKIVLGLDNGFFICLDGHTGEVCWYLKDAFKNTWCLGFDNRIVGVCGSDLRIIDAESGLIISEYPIGADWAASDLRLYEASVTKTHLWAGFWGRGLCAINLDNGHVDYHVFDGGLCDSRPKILNNRVFVAIRKGGLGLGSGRQEYILEGKGGYKPDADGYFAIP